MFDVKQTTIKNAVVMPPMISPVSGKLPFKDRNYDTESFTDPPIIPPISAILTKEKKGDTLTVTSYREPVPNISTPAPPAPPVP